METSLASSVRSLRRIVQFLNFLFFVSDWSLGCFKQTTSNSCFNVTAGDYSPFVNLTGAACVSACSALPNGARFAGLTANGVCVCSELQEICLNQTTDTSCNYPQSDGFYYKVFPVAEMPSMDTPTSVVTFERFNVTIRSAGNVIAICIFILVFSPNPLHTFPYLPFSSPPPFSAPSHMSHPPFLPKPHPLSSLHSCTPLASSSLRSESAYD